MGGGYAWVRFLLGVDLSVYYLPFNMIQYSVIEMSKTMDNLATAFAGESQANRKYLAFAKRADDEGYPQVAKLFRAAAAAFS